MTAALWTSADMAAATGGEASQDFAATGVSIDTRTLKKGEAYVALKGVSLDGHDYVAAAFKAGASCAVVSRDFKAADPAWPLLRVADTMRGLEDLGRAARARFKGRVIGVTGSAGKTGTKEMLAAMLEPQGSVHASRKSFNNHWGVPLTLANLPPQISYAVIEMGMNHAGELAGLTRLVRPHVAIVTTIEPAHIEHFKTVEAIADAKAEIFDEMGASGVAVLNADNPHLGRLKSHAQRAGVGRILTFGEDDAADARLTGLDLHADSSRVEATVAGTPVKFRLNIPGRHIALNAIAALLAVRAAGGDLARAVTALEQARPVEGRGNRLTVLLDGGAATLIDESYNANPASMAAALGVLEMAVPGPGGRRIAVLGDMLELGPEGPRLHAGLANPLLKARVDLVFCCGPQMEALYALLPPAWQGAHAPDSRALAPLATAALQAGDVVLIKGSAGSKMAYVIEAMRARAPRPADSKGQAHAV